MTSERPDPTPLSVFCECLTIIEQLPPHEREGIVSALNNFKLWASEVLRGDAVDWKAQAAKWKAHAESLQDELNESSDDDDDQADEDESTEQ